LTFSSVYGGNKCSMATSGGEMRTDFRMRESVEAGLAIVVPIPENPTPPKGMVSMKRCMFTWVDCTATERQTREEVVDRFLIRLKKEAESVRVASSPHGWRHPISL